MDAVTPEMPLDAPIAVSTSERKACYRGRNSISSQHRGRGPALSCIWDESLPTSFLTQILYTSQIHSVGSRQTQNIDQFFPKHRSTFQSQTKLIFHNLLMLILKYFFFEQSKEGTENERKVQRFPLCPLPPNMHSLPLSIPRPRGPFVNDYHPESIVHLQFHFWCRTFCMFGQMCNDISLSCTELGQRYDFLKSRKIDSEHLSSFIPATDSLLGYAS